MPLCGFNHEMIDGIEVFSNGLFAATMERGRENGVEGTVAVQSELSEIELFVDALNRKFGEEPTLYTNAKAEMIYGVALFAHGLFRATLEMNGRNGQLATNYGTNVEAIGKFLEMLESEHQALKKKFSPEVTMQKAAEWIAAHGA